MAVIEFGEWRPDISDLNAGYTRILSNVVPRADGYGPFKNMEALTATLPAPCRGFFCARRESGAVAIFAGTETNLYRLNNTTLSWDEVSQGGTDYANLPDDANWTFCQFGSYVIACNRNEPPQVYDLSFGSAFADLGGSPPHAGWCSVIGPFLVLADLTSNPYRIHWSGINDVTSWTPGTDRSDFQDMPDSGRCRAVVEIAPDVGLVLQDDGVRRMTYAVGSAVIFQIDRLPNVPGILSPYSVCVAEGGCHYFSTRGFISVDAAGSYLPIGEERVNRTVMGQHDGGVDVSLLAFAYDPTKARLFCGVADPERSLILWVWKTQDNNEDLFDHGAIYHTTLKRWAPVAIMGEYLAATSQPGLTLEALDAIAPGALDISGAADNGSGLIRITVASTSGLTTGNVKTITGVTGTTEANGTWAITVINGTTFDLQGSTFSNAYVDGGLVGGSIDDLPFSLDAIQASTLPSVAAFTDEHELAMFSGDTLEAVLETPEQSLPGFRTEINGMVPITDASSVFGSIVRRETLHETVPVEGDESEMNEDGFIPLLDDARYARSRVRIPAGTVWTFAKGVEPDAARGGRC